MKRQPVLMTIAETAVYMRGEDTPANRAIVARLIANGHLEARRGGRRWMVTKPCLDAYLAPRGFGAGSWARVRQGAGGAGG